ncbi:MAG TPA: vitamin K epoxide reductase family protein [Pirellulales bacterium]|jgi:uncharacterized membrane protein|nr:vitamin K epoxide reductase family protein [Pirellulales bacterium]
MSLSTTDASRLPSGGPAPPARRAWLWIAGLLALMAAGICVYLAWAAIVAAGRVAGCGGGDCADVLSSRWARWFGLPVSLPAVVVYGVVLVALWALARGKDDHRRQRVWYVLVPLATLILVAASWFSALQLLVLGKLCWYCMADHACAIVLAMILLWHVPHDWRVAAERAKEPVGLAPATTLGLVLFGFMGLSVLIAGQLLGKAREPEVEITTVAAAPPSDSEPKAGALPADLSDFFPAPEIELPAAEVRPRRISLLGGKAILDARRTPLLGDLDAEIVLVELFDYTCPHCRQLHRYLSEARKRYGGQLAVAVLVTPMDPKCNQFVHESATEPGSCELARLAVAVWQIRPAAFADFHDWLMESAETRSIAAARARAIEILGEDVLAGAGAILDRAMAEPRVAREIEADNRIYQLAGEGTIPKLLTERLIIAGQPASAAKLFEVLENQVGLRPSGPESR